MRARHFIEKHFPRLAKMLTNWGILHGPPYL